MTADFWKPIGECPKEDRKDYLLLTEGGRVLIGQWDKLSKSWHSGYSEWPEMYIVYHAEIPPSSESETKP